ncbi:MAG: hypothetical protein QM831_28520 [Kofleriaceae bacterium]
MLLELIWLVGPDIAAKDPTQDLPKTQLSLEITDLKKTIKLDPQIGGLKNYLLPMCSHEHLNDFKKHEVARIGFKEGDYGGYQLIRNGTSLDIRDWSQPDGACPDEHGEPGHMCPMKTKHRLTVNGLPAKPNLVEKIVLIDDQGKRTPFTCDPE